MIHYRRLFPWLNIFRALRIAADPRKLLLAAFAYLLLTGGNYLIEKLPFAPPKARNQQISFFKDKYQTSAEHYEVKQAMHALNSESRTLNDLKRKAHLSSFSNFKFWIYSSLQSSRSPLHPLQTVFKPISRLFKNHNTILEVTFSVTQLFWALSIWAIFGGAICRMTALRFARDERMSMKRALQFSGRRFLSYFSAPLLPLSGVACMWLVLFVGGWIGNIPAVGGIVVGVLYGIALLVALGIGLIMFGVACGWSLTQATISVEDSDAFDGFSRSFSYVFSKPWHFLWYVVVALLFGGVAIEIVAFVATVIGDIASWGISTGMDKGHLSELLRDSKSLLSKNPLDWSPPKEGLPAASWFAVAWHYLAGLMVFCFQDSYFWVASTIIYFLLRRVEDATDFDEIHVAEGETSDELLPLVGVAASDQPIIERPHVNGGEKSTEESTESEK